MVYGFEKKERSEYGVIEGPYKDYIGMYIRTYMDGSLTFVGKMVHADCLRFLLLPAVVNKSVPGKPKLEINTKPKFATMVNIGHMPSVEVLADNDKEGMEQLELIVNSFNGEETLPKFH